MSTSVSQSSAAGTALGGAAPRILERTKRQVQPALQAAVATISDERMRLIAGYQLGWCDADGRSDDAGGKAIRPALALLGAQAAGGAAEIAAPAAAAVELVHNFSLLHDDIMDRDVERRHRPTGWVVFGEGQAILAGNAMLTAAFDALVRAGNPGQRCLPCLLGSVQELISGQSQDLDLEGRASVGLADVLRMEAGKTAALLSCAASIGALAVGAPTPVVHGLAAFGHELGIAFQLVDDVLGVVGDPATTGKSASSDVRAGKRSAPIVAALSSGTPAAAELSRLMSDAPPTSDEDVARATALIEQADGLGWASREADARLARALERLDGLDLPDRAAVGELVAVAGYIVARDR
jgi:geranylgeranyl diphosphate synthase type I